MSNNDLTDLPVIKSTFIKRPEDDEDDDISKENGGRKLINPMIFYAKKKKSEEKTYIILYFLNNDGNSDMFSKIYEICIGRTAAYLDIKNKLQSGLSIDVHRSIVITETMQTETDTGNTKYYLIPFDECASVYSFCVSVASFFDMEDFNIEDYADGDVPENNETTDSNSLSSDQAEYKRLLEESMQYEKFQYNRNDLGSSNTV